MKKLIISLIALCAATANALTLNIGIDGLRDENGAFVSTNSLAVVMVDVAGIGFNDTLVGGFSTNLGTSVNDGAWQIVWKGDLKVNETPGLFLDSVQFTLTSETTDKAFAMFWFADETIGTEMIDVSVVYGVYTSTNSTQFDSDHDWSTGTNNGATYSINALAKNGVWGPNAGGLEDSLLRASKTTIPEPSACAGLLGLFALAFVARRHRK